MDKVRKPLPLMLSLDVDQSTSDHFIASKLNGKLAASWRPSRLLLNKRGLIGSTLGITLKHTG